MGFLHSLVRQPSSISANPSPSGMPTTRSALVRRLQPLSRQIRGRLPDLNETWVTFSAEERAILSRYMPSHVLTELASSCSFVGAMYHHRRANPISFAVERTHFKRVASSARALLECFEEPSRDWMQLHAIVELGSGAERGTANTDELRRLLGILASGCERHAQKLPLRYPQHTLEYEVRWIARVTEPAGVKTSAAPGSKFTKIVRTCFAAMGIHSDPGRAIRSYIAHRDDDPLRW